VNPLHISIFLTTSLNTKSSSTKIQTLSALNWFNKLAGFSEVFNHPLCRAIIKASKRSETTSNRKEPLTPEHLGKMQTAFSAATLENFRFLAIMFVAFASFLRISELLNIKTDDLKFSDDHIEIKILGSKTDIYRQGSTVLIAVTNKPTCPCAALTRYILKANISLQKSQYVFRTIVRKSGESCLSNRKLNYSRVRDIFHKALLAIDENPMKYGLHSLRSGGATAAANSGVPNNLIMLQGRWKTESAKSRYIKNDKQRRLLVSTSLNI